MKRKVKAGITGLIERVFIRDTSQTSKVAGLTGLTSASAGLTLYYCRAGDTSATAVALGAGTLGTWSSGGFVEIDPAHMPGQYEVGIPNAAVGAGAKSVGLQLRGAANMEEVPLYYELDAVDYQDGTRFGLGAIPNVVQGNAGALPTGDASGRVTGAANVLDAISVADPGAPGSMTTLPKMIVGIWRRWYGKVTMTATQLKTFKDDGTTVNATATVSDDGTTQTQGAAS